MTNTLSINDKDLFYLRRAIENALEAESKGNCPVGSVITLNDEIIAEAGNEMLVPQYNPIWHAEMSAIRNVPIELWSRANEMTCYTTLEPCIMCTGTVLLHGFGRVVYGSDDSAAGGSAILPHLPHFYEGGRGVPEWVGPCLNEECDPLRQRTHACFTDLPVGPDS
ncbi:MAG: nucleoside deaminase [Gammaproteobacteria bacterium]|nr:nucleoside deaminase [Gammaproteobacteria bacterium]